MFKVYVTLVLRVVCGLFVALMVLYYRGFFFIAISKLSHGRV